MSTVISPESVRQLGVSPTHEGAKAKGKVAGSARKTSRLAGLFAWYRNAVTKPASDEEKAEWQQTSF